METGIVTFFDIKACGFYRLKKNADELEHKFGTLDDIFDALQAWLDDKSVEESIPWDTETHPLRARTYSRGVAVDPDTKDRVIVMYRALGSAKGRLHAVKKTAPVGAAENDTVKTETNGNDYIWVEPCYYWIIPEHNKIASIIFPHSGADTPRLSNYIFNFVVNHGDFGREKNTTSFKKARSSCSEDDILVSKTVFKYVDDNGRKCNCVFKFKTEVTKVNKPGANILEVRDEIVQTIIRDTTVAKVEDTRQPLLRLMSNVLSDFLGTEQTKFTKPKKIEVRVDGAPSEEEIKQLLDRNVDDVDWVDVGFVLKDSSRPLWLKKYMARTALFVSDSTGDEHFSPEKLLQEIKAVRDDLLQTIIYNEEVEEKSLKTAEA